MTKAMVALGLVLGGLAGLFFNVGWPAAVVLFFGLLTCAFADFDLQ